MKLKIVSTAILVALSLTLGAVFTGCPAITGERPPLEVGERYRFTMIDRTQSGDVQRLGPGSWVQIQQGGRDYWINLQFTQYIEPLPST